MLKKIAEYVWTRSPRDYWNRLRNPKGTPWSNRKHAQWNRLPYYLQLFDAACQKVGREFNLRGARVLEIGAGWVFGLVPFAITAGSRSCGIVEPSYREIRGTPELVNDFLLPLYQSEQFMRGGGCPPTFDDFLKQIDAIEMHVATLENAGLQEGEPFDIVISKSCLSEIADMRRAVKVCYSASKPGSIHLHYTGFAMLNATTKGRFGEMYFLPRSAHPESLNKIGGAQNLLRPPDFVDLFRECFSEVHFFPLEEHSGRIDLSQRHPDWSAYSEADLTVANGIVLAVR